MSNVQINSVTTFLKTQHLSCAGGKLIASTQLSNKLTIQVPANSFASVDSNRVIFRAGLESRVVEIGASGQP
jgi:hypothetical protein